MVVLIADLYATLLTKQGQDKITKDEWNYFLNWRAQTLRHCTIGGLITTGLVFLGTRKLNRVNRFTLSGGAGFVAGYFTFKQSSQAFIDQIFGLDGTRMQNELKKIVLRKYGDNPRRMQAFSKYFYGEELYSDSSPEYPKLVYRQRHLFMDYPKETNENAYGVSDGEGKQRDHHQRSLDRNPLNTSGLSKENKQVRVNTGISAYGYGDPLEVLFGYAISKENEQAEASGEARKVQGRNPKRVRRRQRMRQRQLHRESLSQGLPQLLPS